MIKRNLIKSLQERNYNSANNASDLFVNKIELAYRNKKRKYRWLFDNKGIVNIQLSKNEIENIVNNNKWSRIIIAILKDIKGSHDIDIANNVFMIKKNKYKISKFLPKHIAIINDKITNQYHQKILKLTDMYYDFIKNGTLEKLQTMYNIEKEIDKLPCYMPNINLQQYYSDIKTGTAIISIKPEDIITCSTNCSYSSCLREDGEYHETVFQYCLDEHTLIAIIRQNGKNIGRQFIYINGFNVVFGKIYGNIDTSTQKNIQNYIIDKFNANFGLLKKDWIHDTRKLHNNAAKNMISSAASNGNKFGYFDSYSQKKFLHINKGIPWSNFELSFPNPILITGRVMTKKEQYCSRCGVPGNDTALHGLENTRLCEKCYLKLRILCNSCKDYFYINNIIKDGKQHYCKKCAKNNLASCDDCGTIHKKENLQTYGLDRLCIKCIKIHNKEIKLEQLSSKWIKK